jgi:hypothetical protein
MAKQRGTYKGQSGWLSAKKEKVHRKDENVSPSHSVFSYFRSVFLFLSEFASRCEPARLIDPDARTKPVQVGPPSPEATKKLRRGGRTLTLEAFVDKHFNTLRNAFILLVCIGVALLQNLAPLPYPNNFLPGGRTVTADERYQAAIKGSKYAQYELGSMIALPGECGKYSAECTEKGGVLIKLPSDVQHALEWYKRSAVQGFAPAQFALGLMYGAGVGTTFEGILEAEVRCYYYSPTLLHSYTHTLIHSYTHTLIHSYTHTPGHAPEGCEQP